MTPVSKSSSPLRKGPLSLSGLARKWSRTPGASAASRFSRAAPNSSTSPSLARRVKVRSSRAGSTSCRGLSMLSASCTSRPTCSRSNWARGVGTRPRPARTSSGSPVVSRNLARARLMAEGLKPSRLAAPATLPSSSRASRVISRLRSGVLMCMPSSEWEQGASFIIPENGYPHMASAALISCNWCVFRLLTGPTSLVVITPMWSPAHVNINPRFPPRCAPSRSAGAWPRHPVAHAGGQHGRHLAAGIGGGLSSALRHLAMGAGGLPAGAHLPDSGGRPAG